MSNQAINQAEQPRPLLKWTGGKFREFKNFRQYIPTKFNRYAEPFAGGAGVFFALNPQCPVYLNDRSGDLFDFYNVVKSGEYAEQFDILSEIWENLVLYADEIHHAVKGYYHSEANLQAIRTMDFETPPWSWCKYDVDYVHASVIDKIKRIKNIEVKEHMTFTDHQLAEHTETAVKAAFYSFMRDVINGDINYGDVAESVAWFAVREFCYSSMFRFSAAGKFNAPYGGTSYNSKDLSKKTSYLNSEQLAQTFANTEFHCQDFEAFLTDIDFAEDDFIFLDPPYDSPFSSYDNNSFGRPDHIRLRNVLENTPTKWMLVIGQTNFVDECYGSIPDVHVQNFGKTYASNMRNRGEREKIHSIFTNY